jgi:hypothetical protein
MWFMALTGVDIADNTYADFEVEVSAEEVALAKSIARKTMLENGFTIQ